MHFDRRLVLVRHGESEANRDRRVLGQSLAVPLTERGLAQAAAAADRVAELVSADSVLVMTSDARRALQTAEVIADRLGVRLETSELLREQHLGDLEGRPVGELRPLPVPPGLHITEVAWGGGESIAEVHVRMTRLLTQLAARPELPAGIVLVSHGDALRVLQAVLAGRDHRDIDWIGDGLGLGEVRVVR